MISREELETLARLYDLGHQNFDPFSDEARTARRSLDDRLAQVYTALFPGGSIRFSKFKNEITRRIKKFLRDK
jgi:hypothetical protein